MEPRRWESTNVAPLAALRSTPDDRRGAEYDHLCCTTAPSLWSLGRAEWVIVLTLSVEPDDAVAAGVCPRPEPATGARLPDSTPHPDGPRLAAPGGQIGLLPSGHVSLRPEVNGRSVSDPDCVRVNRLPAPPETRGDHFLCARSDQRRAKMVLRSLVGHFARRYRTAVPGRALQPHRGLLDRRVEGLHEFVLDGSISLIVPPTSTGRHAPRAPSRRGQRLPACGWKRLQNAAAALPRSNFETVHAINRYEIRSWP